MAVRPCFYVQIPAVVTSFNQSFEWAPGFSLKQHQKCVANLHYKINQNTAQSDILEVSTRSTNPLGVKLSALKLRYKGVSMEKLYQDAKRYKKVHVTLTTVPAYIQDTYELAGFYFEGTFWQANTDDMSAFYDYLYCLAVKESLSYDEIMEITDYGIFTDIAFNPERSYNTQARACAFIKALIMCYGDIPDWESVDEFKRYHKLHVKA